MLGTHRDQQNSLERELESAHYDELLLLLRRRIPAFQNHTTWSHVIAAVHQGPPDDPFHDKVLKPIFNAHQENQDPRWRANW